MHQTEIIHYINSRVRNIRHVAEIGVSSPDNFILRDFVANPDCRVTLVEANPVCVNLLIESYGIFPNVAVQETALSAHRNESILRIPVGSLDIAASAFLLEQESPYNARARSDSIEPFQDVVVQCCRIDDIDDGSIEVMLLDIEGGEWNVLRFLRSRPEIIIVEMGGPCGYRNPNFDKIVNWMAIEEYDLDHVEMIEEGGGQYPLNHFYLHRGAME
jgi:FkbM family methyltransferase